jgi:hypothetical protein
MVNDEGDQMNKHKGYLSWQVWSTVGWKENKGALPTANAVRIIVMAVLQLLDSNSVGRGVNFAPEHPIHGNGSVNPLFQILSEHRLPSALSTAWPRRLGWTTSKSATTAAIVTPWTRSGFPMHAYIPRNAESDEYTVGHRYLPRSRPLGSRQECIVDDG